MNKRICGIMLTLLLTSILELAYNIQANPVMNLTVETDKQEYYNKDLVQVYGNLTLDGVPITDGLVGLQIQDSVDNLLTIRTLSTGAPPLETPYVFVEHVTLSDQNGNNKSSVLKGTLAYFKTRVANLDIEPHDVLMPFLTYYNDNTPFGWAWIRATISAGSNQTFIISIPIPTDAILGTATVYANAYVDWPKLAGTPYCSEVNATFQITGDTLGEEFQKMQNSLKTLQTDETANYNLEFRLPQNAPYGSYTAYVTSRYFWQSISNSTTFTVYEEVPNQSPYKPTAASQYSSDGVTVIPEGGTTPKSTVVFKATVSDPDGDSVRLEIELRQIGEAFMGEPTPETISDFVSSGTQVTITRYGLINADYKWQYRAKDIHGATSDWTEFGAIGNIDFRVSVPTVYIPSRIKVLMNPSAPPVEMDIEEYLRGVVHAEMNPEVFKPQLGLDDEQMLEALETQAIASRTYAVARVLGIMWNPHHGTGADVCTQDHCQVWSSATDPLSDMAVSNTHNVVITYEGNVIQAFFFGHCDGHTRTPLTAYPTPWVKDLPYCRSVICDCGQTSMLGHGVGMCQYGAMEMARQSYNRQDILKHYYTGTEMSLANPTGIFNVAKLGCLGELRVYDSENRVTGVVNGEIKNEIANSSYDDANKAVIIVFPNDSYRYMIKGTGEGLYDLTIGNVTQSETITFVAVDVPTSDNATHQYTVDWVSLSVSEEGVTVQIDSDADEFFEHEFSSDPELTGVEFEQTILHDISMDMVLPSKNVVGEGYPLSINGTVKNQGSYAEDFNVTIFADRNTTIIGDEIIIGTQIVHSLTNGTSTVVTFTWNTSGFAKGNYTIKAIADTVSGEIDVEDNRKEDGWVLVTYVGDLNGDFKVDYLDDRTFGWAYIRYGQTGEIDPNCDFNNDGKIDYLDDRIFGWAYVEYGKNP